MRDYLKFYINGAWVDPVTPKSIDVINPATESVAGHISMGSAADVDKAVKAARAAFVTWSQTSVDERVALFERLIEEYKKRYADMAAAITEEMGAPAVLSQKAQAAMGIGHLQSALGVLKTYKFQEERGTTMIVKEPIGVCGLITPWNWPVNQIACKVAPALAVGCTMVLKPSEIAPFSAQIWTEVMHAAGVPAGVFNLVNGDGPTVGAAISSHPGVDMVSFTGSTRAGVEVARNAAPTVKRVHQELGGKSPNIILPDADIKRAVTAGVRGVMQNSGQSCNAPTRMLVPNAKMAEALAVAKEVAEATTVGAPGQRRSARPGDLGHAVGQDPDAHPQGHRRGRQGGGRRPGQAGGAGDGLLRQADGAGPCEEQRHGRARGDLRPGADDHRLRHRGRGGGHCQRHALWVGRLCLGWRPRGHTQGGVEAARRPGQHQQRRHRSDGTFRWLQAVGQRARVGRPCVCRVPGNQGRARLRAQARSLNSTRKHEETNTMAAINEVIDLSIEDGIAVVTSNHAPVNALSAIVRDGLTAAFDKAIGDTSVKAIVLTCAGRTFFAGADISEFGKPPKGASLHALFDVIEASPKPVVAAIHGTSLGGGFETALVCHYRVAVPSAKVGLPEVKLGLLAGAGGTQRLPRIVGAAKALEMVTSGLPVGGKAALAAGLVDELAPEAELRATAIAFARKVLAEKRPLKKVRDLTVAGATPELFAEFRAKNAKAFRGFEAPEASIKCIEAAARLPFDEGKKFEREEFVKLVSGVQSQAQRYMFFAERQAAKIDGLPEGTATRPVKKVGVIGAGTMGGGIAMNFAEQGHPGDDRRDASRGAGSRPWRRSARTTRTRPPRAA